MAALKDEKMLPKNRQKLITLRKRKTKKELQKKYKILKNIRTYT